MVTIRHTNYTYEWWKMGKAPRGWGSRKLAAVGVDANDNVYALTVGQSDDRV